MNETVTFPHRISFAVADVKPGNERLPAIALRKALEQTLKTDLVCCPKPSDLLVEAGDFHPLIAAAALAFKRHYPLVLSPDMIWLTVLQGVAQHIANHAEKLRNRLVQHQTRIELGIDTNLPGPPRDDREMLALATAFADLIAKHVRPDKQFLLKAEFTTTTDVERIAGSIVLMDAFQPYFDYFFACICGIPTVTLEGSPDDWELLSAKVQALQESDLELSWWTKHLLPLCDQFVRASHGEIDHSHWQDLCKLVKRYGADDLNGWLLKFIPYVRRERNELPTHRNPVLEPTAINEEPDDSYESVFKIPGCTSDMLPTGLSRAPVTCLNRQTGATYPYQFVAGFTGVSQSHDDLSLRPVIGWAIAKGARIDELIERLRTEHEVHPPERTESRFLIRLFGEYLPADLWRFYTQTDGATIRLGEAAPDGLYCSIKGVGQIKAVFDFECIERELKLLSKQGILTPNDYDERRRFVLAYSRLYAFAEAYRGKDHFIYVFGRDPEKYVLNEDRGEVFRWTGESTRDAFEPVAHTFTEWLADLLEC